MKIISPRLLAVVTSLLFIPLFAYAQTRGQVSTGITSLSGLIELVTNTVIKSLATLALSLALLAFFWGIVEYIWARRSGDTKGVQNGAEFMKWGLVALFVMFSVYGIIKFGQGIIFGGADVTTIKIPNINFGGGSGSGPDTTAPNSPATGTCNSSNEGSSCANGSGTCQGGKCVTGSTPPPTGSGLLEGERCSGSEGLQGPCASGLVCSDGSCMKS